jgi:hypothetical protein
MCDIFDAIFVTLAYYLSFLTLPIHISLIVFDFCIHYAAF